MSSSRMCNKLTQVCIALSLFVCSTCHAEFRGGFNHQGGGGIHGGNFNHPGGFNHQGNNFNHQDGNYNQQGNNFNHQDGNYNQQGNNFNHQDGNYNQQGNNFYHQDGNYNQQGGAVVVGAPIEGYYGGSAPYTCPVVQQCYPNGSCVQSQVCN